MEMYSLLPLEVGDLKAISLGWDWAMWGWFQGASFPWPLLHTDSPNHFCKIPFGVFTCSNYCHRDIMGCYYLTWLAAVLVSLDSATQDQFLLLEFLAFHKAQPSRDILRINFAVLVETVYVALLPDNVLNDSGLFPKTQLKTLLSQISFWVRMDLFDALSFWLYISCCKCVLITSFRVINLHRERMLQWVQGECLIKGFMPVSGTCVL